MLILIIRLILPRYLFKVINQKCLFQAEFFSLQLNISFAVTLNPFFANRQGPLWGQNARFPGLARKNTPFLGQEMPPKTDAAVNACDV